MPQTDNDKLAMEAEAIRRRRDRALVWLLLCIPLELMAGVVSYGIGVSWSENEVGFTGWFLHFIREVQSQKPSCFFHGLAFLCFIRGLVILFRPLPGTDITEEERR